MLENATRLCEAAFGSMVLCEGDAFRRVALHNAPQAFLDETQRRPLVERGASALDRLVRTKQFVHVADMAVESPDEPIARFAGARTMLLVPMFKESELIGAFGIYRQEVRPFTDKQIELVQNFAAQAVIAIENARLLNELRHRTDDLSEALEQQTATSEVLKIVSSSPGELEPVFQAMLENAMRICGAKFGTLYLYDGDAFHAAAFHNAPPAFVENRKRAPIRPRPDSGLGRVAKTRQVAHIADITKQESYLRAIHLSSPAQNSAATGPSLAVPMLKENELIGVITICAIRRCAYSPTSRSSL